MVKREASFVCVCVCVCVPWVCVVRGHVQSELMRRCRGLGYVSGVEG